MMTAVPDDLRSRSVSGYGATIRDMWYREHARFGQAAEWTMSCELALVTWPPSDSPGCAVSAGSQCRVAARSRRDQPREERIRVIGSDIHRVFAEAAALEDGTLGPVRP